MWYIDTDNIIKVIGLKNVETGTYVNDAVVTMTLYKVIPQYLSGTAVTANAGSKTTLTIVAHGLTTNDYIRIFGTVNYDGQYAIDSVPDADSITITATFVAETFVGTEEVYAAVSRSSGTWPETLSYAAASDGNYNGQLPNELYLFPGELYELVLTEVSGTDQVLMKLLQEATFKGF